MDDKPRHRRLRFGLRTLFVVTTLCACWLAWQTHLVSERRELWSEWEGAYNRPTMYARLLVVRNVAPTAKELPWWHKLLGDRPYQGPLIVLDTTSSHEIERLAAVFPEAGLQIVAPVPTPGKDLTNH